MRKNTQDALDRWNRGVATPPSRQGGAVWTDGEVIWSYQTAIVARDSEGVLRFNDTRYSVTTSIQQGGLRYELSGYDRYGAAQGPVEYVDGIPRGSGSLARLLASQDDHAPTEDTWVWSDTSYPPKPHRVNFRYGPGADDFDTGPCYATVAEADAAARYWQEHGTFPE